jgi:uncharacterized delta-60 repeat protein
LANTPGTLALQSDGKILMDAAVPGSPSRVIQRYETNGQLDTSFGTAGSASLIDLGPITLQSNGEILVPSSGLSSVGGLVVRYSANGSLDTQFGISGQAGLVASPAALAVQSDGRIVAAGTITSQLSLSGNSFGFGLVRLNKNGMIDTRFGTRGGVITSFPSSNVTSANALVIQPNGDIVAAGEAGTSNQFGTQLVESFALARYLNNGELDTSFGSGGLVTTSFGNNAVASISALALQSDGKIVAVGSNDGGDMIVARYLGQ